MTNPMPDNTVKPAEPVAAVAETPDSPNAEAAKWRHKARSAEERAAAAELAMEALNARIEASQKAIVNQSIAGKLVDAEDFWRDHSLAELLSDTGDVDNDRIDAAVSALIEAHPHWAAAASSLPTPSASQVSGQPGGVGFPPKSVLDTHVQATESRSWADIIQQGANGE
jgi:hypothetical protein